MTPGPYTVRETAVAGWTLSDIDCGANPSGGGSSYLFQPSNMASFQAGDISVDITLAAGDAVTCTFTNTEDGAITIVKDTVPDDAQDFVFDDDITGDGGMGGNDFTLDDDADGTLSNTESFANVTPGVYTVRETVVAGWVLSDIDCGANPSAGGSSYLFQPSGMVTFQVGDISVDITLAAGDAVTCTFTNTETATVTVTKVINDEFDDRLTDEFTVTINGGNDLVVTNTGADPDMGTSATVMVDGGSPVTIVESITAGPGALGDYTRTLSCDNSIGTVAESGTPGTFNAFTAPAGADVACTLTNTFVPPTTITVTKDIVDPGNGGLTDEFTVTINGGDDLVVTNTGADPDTGTSAMVTVGGGSAVTIAESITAGPGTLGDYARTLSCDNSIGMVAESGTPGTFNAFTAPAGADVTCTLTNTFVPPTTITVTKDIVDPGDGGLTDEFTVTINGGDDLVVTNTGADPDTGTSAMVTVGGGSAVTIAESITAGPGTLGDYARTLSCDNSIGMVAESGTPGTFNAFTAPAGADVTCTLTNTFVPPTTITVTKDIVDPGDGGLTDEFTVTINGGDDLVVTNTGADPDTGTSATVMVGGGSAVTIAEPITAGPGALGDYTRTLSCDNSIGTVAESGTPGTFNAFTAPAGADVACTLTNTFVPPTTVEVTKDIVDPTDGGLNDAFTVTINGGDDLVVTNTAGDPDTDTSAMVMVGGGSMVTIAESITAGTGALGDYTRALSCDNGIGPVTESGTPGTFNAFTAPAGADVTCTLTNTFVPLTVGAPPPAVTQSLTVTKIVVNTGGGTLGVADFPLWIDGNATTSGQAVSVSADTHTVSETGADNYDAVISGDCDVNGAVTVASGGASSCTITNTFVPSDDPAPDPLPPLPDLIFTDGFESGDTSVWTDVDRVPGPSSDSYQNGGGTNSSGLRTAQGAAVPIADAVASIVGDYDAIFVYDPTINAVNLSDNFLVYRPEPALAFLNTLTELRSGQAYFIFNSDPDGIVWEQGLAIVEARSVALVSGFNYVGWSGPELAPLADATAGISADVFSAFLWDAEAQEYLVYWRDAPSALNLNTFDVIPFARGLWLLMDQAVTWLQPARDG